MRIMMRRFIIFYKKYMKTSVIVWIVVIVLVILGLWWYFSSPAEPSSTLGTQDSIGQTNTGAQTAAPVLAVASDATLGNYLVASNGMTLYLYTPDTKDVSNCYGTCAANWPPYVRTSAEPLTGAAGVTGTIATTDRTDGSKQIMYNGVPLYFWINDAKPGDTTGHNFNGVWFVVKP
jgi:predicted lipoprotein with Yx(FWY)xxD motif